MASDLYYRVGVDAGGAGYDLSEDISSFTLEQRDAQPDQLRIEVNDPYKVLSHALQEGMSVEVDLGTADAHAVVFRGRIYRVDGTFPEDGAPALTLVAYDGTMRMGLRPRNRTFADMPLSAIVTNVAREYFDDVRVDVVGDVFFDGNGIRQDDETDLAFLLRLAESYGCVMHAKAEEDGESFHFVAQHTIMSADPDVTLYYGRGGVSHRLLSFQSSADVSHVELPRVLSGIDYKAGKPIDPTTTELVPIVDEGDTFFDENLTALRSTEPVKSAQLELLVAAAPAVQTALRQELGSSVHDGLPTFTSESEIAALALNQFTTNLFGMRASGRAAGTKDLFARTNVAIRDVGGRFSSIWYLALVRHLLNSDGYRTEFECRR